MLGFAYAHLVHVLALLILVSRLGDVGTTYLATPTLQLEANPIVRRLGWRFAIATLAECAVPYVSTELGVMVLVPSLLVAGSNASRIWIARTLGEAEYWALLMRLARRSRLSHALAGVCASAAFVMLTGSVVLLFYPDPSHDWAFWIGAGIISYGAVLAVHGSLAFVRLFRKAAIDSPSARIVGRGSEGASALQASRTTDLAETR